MTTQTKAKKRLSNIQFDSTGAHIALVSKDQGGPANGHDYALVLKASNFSDEFVQKMQQVKVTMELPDFLQKFFHIYYEDAQVLARMMGYVQPEAEVVEDSEDWYENYIQSKLEAFEILKAAYEADSLADVLSALKEDEYLAILQDQAKIEKAFKKIDKQSKESKPVAKQAAVDDTSKIDVEVKQEEEVSASVLKQANKETVMTQEVKTVEQEVTVEMVEKAAFESVQKALDEQKVALQKAMETIAQFEAEKKAAIEKARKSEVLAAVKDEGKAEVLFKAVKDADAADFEAVVKALQELTAAADKSDLFVEKGASGEAEVKKEESAVERLLKAKYAKQGK
jgi:hypothetical protein